MLFEGLDRLKRNALLSAIILMIAGHMLLAMPSEILVYFNELAGFGLLVYAVLSIFNFLSSKKALIHYIYLTIGLLGGMLGFFFLIFDNLMVNIMIWMVCVFPVISGIYGIYHAFMFARRSGRKGWWILVILSAALIVFGGFVFYNPWVTSTEGTMRIIGATMMYTSILSCLSFIWLWPIKKASGEES